MRVAFHKFTELETGKPVVVNPSLVRCIRQADAEDHVALLEFGDDHVVAVSANVDSAVSMLTSAQDRNEGGQRRP